MNRILIVAALLLGGWLATDEAPRTFPACVLRGGVVRMADHDVQCRYVESSTIRTYLTGTTECGEEVEFDAWGETRSGVVTYLLDIRRVDTLREVTDSGIPEMPMPCLRDPGGAGS